MVLVSVVTGEEVRSSWILDGLNTELIGFPDGLGDMRKREELWPDH